METTSTLTKEQRELRIGKFNGSENYKLMGAKGLGKTGETYIFEKAAEFLTGLPNKPEISSQSTEWGCFYEPEAKLYFESASGINILPCDTLENGEISGTPDGILKRTALEKEITTGIEIKCPFNSGNHLKNLSMQKADDLLELRPEYYWQIVSYMWLTDLKKWKFCSFDPRFKDAKRMLILNIELNEDHLTLLKNRVAEAKFMFNNIISKL